MGGATELEPGEVFAGRYEVQRLLGEGDRKRTYLARDTKMDRFVAVSLVKPEGVLSDPEGTEREAKVLGRIGEHDNIVSLYNYEIDSAGSVQYMVFEYLSGLVRKFAGGGAHAARACGWVLWWASMRCSRSSRSVRVNFQPNGLAMAL
jgi:hypothetical protein